MALPDSSVPRKSNADIAAHLHCDGVRELVLCKRGQRYVFACAPGEQMLLLEQLRRMARDPDSGIEWFEAALLARHLGVVAGKLDSDTDSFSPHSQNKPTE